MGIFRKYYILNTPGFSHNDPENLKICFAILDYLKYNQINQIDAVLYIMDTNNLESKLDKYFDLILKKLTLQEKLNENLENDF